MLPAPHPASRTPSPPFVGLCICTPESGLLHGQVPHAVVHAQNEAIASVQGAWPAGLRALTSSEPIDAQICGGAVRAAVPAPHAGPVHAAGRAEPLRIGPSRRPVLLLACGVSALPCCRPGHLVRRCSQRVSVAGG